MKIIPIVMMSSFLLLAVVPIYKAIKNPHLYYFDKNCKLALITDKNTIEEQALEYHKVKTLAENSFALEQSY